MMGGSARSWLEELPANDRAGPFSFDAWEERGRAIPSVTAALASLLAAEDLSAPTRRAINIVYALGRVGDQGAVKPLLAAAAGGADLVRAEAVGALGSLGAEEALPLIRGLALDHAEDLNVRANACIAIGGLKPEDGLAILEQVERSPTRAVFEGDVLLAFAEGTFLREAVKAARAMLREPAKG
jgi:HEAT repeat protein